MLRLPKISGSSIECVKEFVSLRYSAKLILINIMKTFNWVITGLGPVFGIITFVTFITPWVISWTDKS